MLAMGVDTTGTPAAAVHEGLQRVHGTGHLVVEVGDERDVEVVDEALGLLVRLAPR